ncbi:MAG: hypothetical protein ACJZ4L_03410 [Candidatus Poriferisodalaceae bacterium]
MELEDLSADPEDEDSLFEEVVCSLLLPPELEESDCLLFPARLSFL